jgi:hypothetical protein
MSITEANPAAVSISVGMGSQVAVLPLHRGHHAIWASANFQADICNMVDDVVVRDLGSGLLYRFPIDSQRLSWVQAIVEEMDDYDGATSPWARHNVGVRAILVDVAIRRIQGSPPQRNILEPGLVAPAVVCAGASSTVDDMLHAITAASPDALVPES